MTAIMLSGGPDSTVLVHHLVDQGLRPLVITLDLGDREARIGRRCATAVADRLGLEVTHLDLAQGMQIGYGKAHPQFMRMPMQITEEVEPFGSGVALALAASVARRHGAERLFYGVQGDDAIFRDNNPEYFALISRAVAMEQGCAFTIETPFLGRTKAQVLTRGVELGVDLASTWSCGYGEPTQCGECHPCTLRQEAFARAGIEDRTTYRVVRTGPMTVAAR